MNHLFQRRAAVAMGVAALLIGALACDMPGGAAPTATAVPDTLPPAPTPTEVAEVTAAPCEPPLPNASIVRDEKWEIYCNDAYGFGFRYPAGGEQGVAPGDVNIFLPFVAGTNLTEKYISVTTVEGAVTCESPNTASMTSSETVNIGGIDWYKQVGSDAGAGQFYDWVGYSNLNGELCVSLTFIMHSNSPGVFETPPAEFNKDVESVAFPLVMETFIFYRPGGLLGEGQGQEPVPTAEGSVVNNTDCNPPAATGPDADKVFGVYCNTEFRFGFRYAPVGDAGYVGAGPIAMPFEPTGDLAGHYLDVAPAADQMGCFASQEGKTPEEMNYQNVTINNIAYVRTEGDRVSPTTGLYEHWTGYGTTNANVCLVLTFVQESTSATPAYDKAAISAIYETIAGTVIWY